MTDWNLIIKVTLQEPDRYVPNGVGHVKDRVTAIE